MSQFQLAAMARTKRPEDERQDFFLFIDEFQNFVTEAFTSMLSEARKYLCASCNIDNDPGTGTDRVRS